MELDYCEFCSFRNMTVPVEVYLYHSVFNYVDMACQEHAVLFGNENETGWQRVSKEDHLLLSILVS